VKWIYDLSYPMMLHPIIKQGRPEDLEEIKKLFNETVRSICKGDYDDEQIEAWSSSINDTHRWVDLVTNQYLLTAKDGGKLIGFGSMNERGYIEMMYVHKDYQGRGIAKTLFQALEKEAYLRGQTELRSEVSKTARPFFEKVGFKVLAEQEVVRQGVVLVNFKMAKNVAFR
jgi:putative acetyltransferase